MDEYPGLERGSGLLADRSPPDFQYGDSAQPDRDAWLFRFVLLQCGLRLHVALLRGSAIPIFGRTKILWNAQPVFIHSCEAQLSI